MRSKLGELAVQMRFWGVQGLVRSLHYSVLSTWADLRRPRPRGSFVPVGRVREVRAEDNGATARLADASLEIRFLLPDLVRLTWLPAPVPVAYAIAWDDWPGAPVTVSQEDDGWRVRTAALEIAVSRDATVTIADGAGHVLRRERPPERRGEAWRQTAELDPQERVFGLGEHTGPLNLRGSRRRLWNTDPMRSYGPHEDPLYMGIPVIQSVRGGTGCLVFFENSFPADFTFAGTMEATFDGGALRSYVTPGLPERTLSRYAELTGRPPLPPRWALGYHQSRFSYQDEREVTEVADGFREHGLPLCAIHLDIHYMDGFRVFTVDRARFPDLGRLAAMLEARGIRLVVILDPGVKRDEGFHVFREGIAGGHFCRTRSGRVAIAPVWPGWSAFPDFTDPAARRWWGGKYRDLAKQGVSGFWNDMNEPALVALWGERTLARDIVHDFDGRGGTHREGHNLYGLLMARAAREGAAAARPDRRPFILTRSGWAGIQRHAWMWTGDIASGWPMLHQTVRTVLGLGLSGMPYAGPDIGGFKGRLTAEAYLRWFELAAFLPFFRTHSSQSMGPREPWRFGEEALAVVRALLALRSDLLPVFYTLAWEASRTGHPLVRPLFWADPDGERVRDCDDAFLLGNDLLVAPVLGPGETARAVDLPAGEWVHLWTDAAFAGSARVDAPPGRPPVFVRAGTVLARQTGDQLALHLYASSCTERGGPSTLYLDAGDGHGAHRVDTFTLAREGTALRLDREESGAFAFPFEDVGLVPHRFAPRRLRVDGVVRPGPHFRARADFRTAIFEA